ncbi:class I SAM-dependent methyltransferase [Streptococcus hyointestinalis]|uniref:class I SAM-dependent methyltransferase n=1 Tax=Streptococcus hyointestinalis TaxID=1337 RepID=UPI003519BDA7
MSVSIDHYKKMLAQPWGKIQYELTFHHLRHITNKKVLDFGAGFGLTSQHLAKHNQVTAVEPNCDLLFADSNQNFTKIAGSLEVLETFPNKSFDVILCHNVLEYIPKEEHADYLAAFERLLTDNGELSLIKHNLTGKVMQAVVFENNTQKANALLAGDTHFDSPSFSQGNSYTLEELVANTRLKLQSYQGMRTFYSLQPNNVKMEKDWLERMLALEIQVADLKPYKDIAFLQYVTLTK